MEILKSNDPFIRLITNQIKGGKVNGFSTIGMDPAITDMDFDIGSLRTIRDDALSAKEVLDEEAKKKEEEKIQYCKDCKEYKKDGKPTDENPDGGQKVDTIRVTDHK